MEGAVDVEVEVDGDSDILAAAQDFNKVARAQKKAGFAEGSAKGHEIGLQDGFRAGLSVACQTAIHFGRVKGAIQSVLILCEPMSEHHTTLKQLLEELELKTAVWKQSMIEQTHCKSTDSANIEQQIGELADSEVPEELKDIVSKVERVKHLIISLQASN